MILFSFRGKIKLIILIGLSSTLFLYKPIANEVSPAALKHMQEEILDRKVAAEQFAAKIKELAETGSIESLSITIHAWSSDELFKLAQSLGIKELSVTAQFGS